MELFRNIFLSFICFLPTLTLAANVASANPNTYAIGLDFGFAKPTNAGNSVSFPLGYSTFSYSSSNNNGYASITGISFNKLFMLAPLYSVQFGGSYHYISNLDVNGDLTQGISPPYYQANYTYSINSSQFLIDAKLRREFCTNFFPYFYIGAGLASNNAFGYKTNIPAYLTVTPDYSNKTTTAFTYSVGAGIDYVVMAKLSVGLGYRFINLGKAGLGNGTIRNTPVNAALTQSHLYTNSLLAQVNYFI